MFSRSKDTNEPGFLQRHFGHQVGSVVAFIFDVLQIVIVSAAIIMVIRYFLIQPFYVKGASMEPNFYDREYLIIDELTFRFRAPERGEIVVFRYPRDPSQYFIKRIVGLPGETVEVIDGHVVVYNDIYPNGIILEELPVILHDLGINHMIHYQSGLDIFIILTTIGSLYILSCIFNKS